MLPTADVPLGTDTAERGHEAMPVTLICPNLKCRTILQVPDKARGRKVKCGRCGRNFVVPAPAGTSAKKAPPANATAEKEAATIKK